MARRVEMWGDWPAAQKFFNGFAYRLNRYVDGAGYNEARRVSKMMKDIILKQELASEWPALSEQTLRQKKTEGETRTLVDTKDYVDAIHAFRVGPKTWAVGITDPKESLKGMALEYGTAKAPARPHWRVAFEKLRNPAEWERGPLAAVLQAVVNRSNPEYEQHLIRSKFSGEGEEE